MCFHGTKQNRIEKTLLLFEAKSAFLQFAIKVFKIQPGYEFNLVDWGDVKLTPKPFSAWLILMQVKK